MVNDPVVTTLATADPDTVQQVQSALGRNQAGDAVERFFGRLARNLRDGGVRRFVVAAGVGEIRDTEERAGHEGVGLADQADAHGEGALVGILAHPPDHARVLGGRLAAGLRLPV